MFYFSGITSLTTYAQILFVLAVSSLASAVKLRNECNDALECGIMLVEALDLVELLFISAFLGVSGLLLCFYPSY